MVKESSSMREDKNSTKDNGKKINGMDLVSGLILVFKIFSEI